MTRRFELRFTSSEDLSRELESNLRRGRTFLRGEVAAADRSPCLVVVFHPESGVEVELAGEVVFAQTEGDYVGIGVDLVDPDLAERLARLTETEDAPVEELGLEPVGSPIEEQDAEQEDAEPRPSFAPDSRRGITVHERVRKLTPAARDKLARTGNLSERIALERAFGAAVWEPLLENNQLTGAELAKIAKNGMAPATVLAHIAGHAGWLAKPEVRRALLSNARLPAAQVERVLRALPQTELRLVPSQAAYPAGVRALARRLL